MVVFMTRTFFGFVVTFCCFAGLFYMMLIPKEEVDSQFTAMYFSLLSFVTGYFLASAGRMPQRASVIPQ